MIGPAFLLFDTDTTSPRSSIRIAPMKPANHLRSRKRSSVLIWLWSLRSTDQDREER